MKPITRNMVLGFVAASLVASAGCTGNQPTPAPSTEPAPASSSAAPPTTPPNQVPDWQPSPQGPKLTETKLRDDYRALLNDTRTAVDAHIPDVNWSEIAVTRVPDKCGLSLSQSGRAEGESPETALPQLLGATNEALTKHSFPASTGWIHPVEGQSVLVSDKSSGGPRFLLDVTSNVQLAIWVPLGDGQCTTPGVVS